MRPIEWSLEGISKEDPADPLGRIAIRGDEGAIVDDSVMLDSFFEALMEGLSHFHLDRQHPIAIDTIDEPFPLVFEPVGQGVRLSFGKQVVLLGCLKQLSEAVCEAARDFVLTLDRTAIALDGGRLRVEKLRTFLHQIDQDQAKDRQE